MRSLPRALQVLAVTLALSSVAIAQPDDALAVGVDPDPMELARVVRRVGDDSVLGRLEGSLTAVRAAPQLPAPELALPALVTHAAGRDPWLAPAAMQSILEITEDLDAHGLGRREADAPALAAEAERLSAIAADETARADLRVAATLAAGRLRALVGDRAER